MEVILLEKIHKLGNLGDKVNVKRGYGDNFLIPLGKAVPATSHHLAEFEAHRAELEVKAAAQLKSAEERAEHLNGKGFTVEANASEEGNLYGSVGVGEIAHAISLTGVSVEKKEISLPEGPIRTLGEFEIQLLLPGDVSATVTINVVAVQE